VAKKKRIRIVDTDIGDSKKETRIIREDVVKHVNNVKPTATFVIVVVIIVLFSNFVFIPYFIENYVDVRQSDVLTLEDLAGYATRGDLNNVTKVVAVANTKSYHTDMNWSNITHMPSGFADDSDNGTGGNTFDQDLNTTDTPLFDYLQLTSGSLNQDNLADNTTDQLSEGSTNKYTMWNQSTASDIWYDGSVNITGVLKIENEDANLTLYASDGSRNPHINFWRGDWKSDAYVDYQLENDGGNFYLRTLYNGVELTPITVQYNSHIGLNTTSPGYVLDVDGKTRLQDNVFVNGTLNLNYIKASDANGLMIGDDSYDGYLFFENGGQIGINTDSPTIDLHIYENSGTAGLRLQSDNGNAFDYYKAGYHGSQEWQVGVLNASNHYQINTNSPYIQCIDIDNETGYVGIGDATPSYDLDVVGDIRCTDDMFVNDDLGVGGSMSVAGGSISISAGAPMLKYTETDDGNYARLGVDSGFLFYDYDVDQDGGFTPYSRLIVLDKNTTYFNQNMNDINFRIYTRNNIEAFYIDGGNSRVGIGTNTPRGLLDIQTKNSGADISQYFGYLDYGFYWTYNGAATGNKNALELWTDGAGGLDVPVFEVEQDGQLSFNQSVGIGTNTPSYELDVNGDIRCTDDLYVDDQMLMSNGGTTWKIYVNASGILTWEMEI